MTSIKPQGKEGKEGFFVHTKKVKVVKGGEEKKEEEKEKKEEEEEEEEKVLKSRYVVWAGDFI